MTSKALCRDPRPLGPADVMGVANLTYPDGDRWDWTQVSGLNSEVTEAEPQTQPPGPVMSRPSGPFSRLLPPTRPTHASLPSPASSCSVLPTQACFFPGLCTRPDAPVRILIPSPSSSSHRVSPKDVALPS